MNLEHLLSLAQQAGASDAEVYYSTSLSRPISFEANRLKQLESVQSEGVGLRLWHKGRCGLAVAYGPVDPNLLVEKALALSQVGSEEEPLLAATSPPTWDLSAPMTTVPDLIGYGQEVTDRIRAAYPDVLCHSDWSLDQETWRILNTRGLDCQCSDHAVSGSVVAEWTRGDDLLEVAVDQDCAPRPGQSEVRLQLDRLVEEVLQRLAWAEGEADPIAGNLPVIFTARAADLVLGSVAAALNGRTVSQSASPWTEKPGQTVLSPLLSLHQDPLLGTEGSPFDDEGVACRRLSFVRQGVLETFYCDQRIAAKLGLDPSGNGFRYGLSSYPSPGLYNLILPEADLSFEELLGQMGEGIVVDQVLGSGGGLSGEFSFNLDLGYRVHKGEIAGRIKDTMVAGNAYTALQQVVALGGERQWSGLFYAPALWIRSVSVTA